MKHIKMRLKSTDCVVIDRFSMLPTRAMALITRHSQTRALKHAKAALVLLKAFPSETWALFTTIHTVCTARSK